MPPRTSPIAWMYILLLTGALAFGLLSATPSPQDDFALYQSFIESLAYGKFDLTIAGFHGTDIFGLVVYILTASPIAQVYGLMIAAMLLPLCGFFAGRELFKSDWHGVILASIVTMMPFISFVLLRGWTGPGYWVWMLATVAFSARRSPWAGVTFGMAIISKPFAIALLPLMIVLFSDPQPHGFLARVKAWRGSANFNRVWKPVGIGLGIASLYVIIQFLQAGRVYLGAHADTAVGDAIQSPMRIFLNLAHSLQILFSVHNYYYPNPELTGPGNMMHTTPVLIFLALFGLLATKNYWNDLRIPKALFYGAVAGIGLNALLDHMDHFYMEAPILLLILASLPVLKKHPLWIPIVLATLHFQWLYFWLQYKGGFSLGWEFFAVPVIVDACFAGWFLVSLRKNVI